MQENGANVHRNVQRADCAANDRLAIGPLPGVHYLHVTRQGAPADAGNVGLEEMCVQHPEAVQMSPRHCPSCPTLTFPTLGAAGLQTSHTKLPYITPSTAIPSKNG